MFSIISREIEARKTQVYIYNIRRRYLIDFRDEPVDAWTAEVDV